MFIRFFHALFSLPEKVNFSIRNHFRREDLAFGDLSDYESAVSGFLTVTVSGVRTRNIYLQKTLPFFSPGAFTVALIPGSMGMDLLQIPDGLCTLPSPAFGCIRTVNLTDDPSLYHFHLYGKRLLFPDVTFRHITTYKQIKEGTHGVYLTLPSSNAPQIPSVFPLQAGDLCTCYVYGSRAAGTLSLLKVTDGLIPPLASPERNLP